MIRIAFAGQFEEVGALRAAELQRARQSGERGRRYRDVASLLNPGVPGRTKPAELRHLLASQPRRASPASSGKPDRLRRQSLSVRPDEFAKLAPLIKRSDRHHGSQYTSINGHLKPVSAP